MCRWMIGCGLLLILVAVGCDQKVAERKAPTPAVKQTPPSSDSQPSPAVDAKAQPANTSEPTGAANQSTTSDKSDDKAPVTEASADYD